MLAAAHSREPLIQLLQRLGVRKRLLSLIAAVSVACGSSTAEAAESLASSVTPFFNDYCHACHDASTQEAAVNLELFRTERDVYTNYELVEAIIRHVGEQRDMPPPDADQPKAERRTAVVAFLRDKLENPDPTILNNPGFVPPHRLSNRQYRNTIRDLVGVGMEIVDTFPADEAVDGFDHMSSALQFSSMHMERYLKAARYIVDRAFPAKEPQQFRVEAEMLPYLETFGRKGFEEKATIPIGHPKSEIVDGFHRFYVSGGITIPLDARQSGYYDVRIRVDNRTVGGPVGGRFEILVDGQVGGRITHLHQRAKKPVELSTRVLLNRGPHDVRLAWEGMNTDVAEPTAEQLNYGALDWVEITGPVSENAAMHEQIARQLLSVRPGLDVSDTEAVRNTIARFASRAYRRPATRADVDRLVRFSGVTDGVPYEQACQRAFVAMLASPKFLLHNESVRSSTESYQLGQFELANRLSYFLWSTMPDAELMRAAGQGELRDADKLAAQVDRMLADPRAIAFAESFAPQWLGLGSLFAVDRNGKEFKDFIRQRRAIREAMLDEVVLVCDEVFRSDTSLLTLLDADFTYVNRDTAKQYGVAGIETREMQRVALSGQLAAQRGGLPTMAGVLMAISHPSDTNPSGRGKWILDALLGQTPPPPPPDVEPLPKPNKDTSKLTLRERLAAHRNDPNCASCHEKIDPLGFALENFDQNGTWRNEEAGRPVETVATLPDGTTINGVVALKRYLVEQQRDAFLKHFAERTLSYALRRPLQFSDRGTVNESVRSLNRGGERFRDLVLTIVTSDAFHSQQLPDSVAAR